MCNIWHENYIQIERTEKYIYHVGEITSWLCCIAINMYVEGEGVVGEADRNCKNHCHRVTTQLQLINIIIKFLWQTANLLREIPQNFKKLLV
jgi:hypothetical protein